MWKPSVFIEMNIKDGIDFVSQGKDVKLYIGTQRVSTASGSALFIKEQDNLECVCCNLKADKWQAIACSPHQPPVLNLYGADKEGTNVLFTRDHIIPKALGGTDDVENLRVMCAPCNQARQCQLEPENLDFYLANKDKFVAPKRIQETIKKIDKGLRKKLGQTKDIKPVMDSFTQVFEHLEKNNAMDEMFIEFKGQLELMKPLYEEYRLYEEDLKIKKMLREMKK